MSGRAGNGRSFARLWPGSVALIALLALLALAGGARAQGPVQIVIGDPAAWRIGLPDTLEAGAALHVTGTASGPSGVSRVLVDGVPSVLRLDDVRPGLVHFDSELVPKPGARSVTIVVEPNTGDPVSRSYGIVVRSAGAVAAPLPPAVPPAQPDSMQGVAIIPVITVTPPHRSSPWGHYALRSIAYAGLAGGGVYLMTQKKSQTSEVCSGPPGAQNCVERTVVTRPNASLGLGLAAGAAVLDLLDTVITAHRAQSRATARAEDAPRDRAGLALPTLEPDGRGARLTLVRLRF